MKDVFSVEGKVTVVTGGGTGIGIAIAREFAIRGAPVLIACPAVNTPQRATSDHAARSGASTPSCSQMRALTVGMYG